jgi:hypothetical protein
VNKARLIYIAVLACLFAHFLALVIGPYSFADGDPR